MKPKTLFLHPGLSKCGSTALQFTLAANAERLAEQGLCVPKAATNSLFPGHHVRLARAIQRDDINAYREAKELILAEAEGHDGVVVSSEGLQGLGGHPMMQDFLSTFDKVQVLVFIRPHAERLPSAFSQQIKNGYAAFAAEGADLFSAWKRSIVDRKDHEYDSTVLAWLANPNVTSVRVGYYSRTTSRDDILSALDSFLDRSVERPAESKDVNPSLSVDGLKFKLALNRLLPKVDLDQVTLMLFNDPIATARNPVTWHDEQTASFAQQHYERAIANLKQAARSDTRLVLDARLSDPEAIRIETGPSEVLYEPLDPESYRSILSSLHEQDFSLTGVMQQAFCSIEAEHWPAIRLHRQLRHMMRR
ncbi:hypothetical protein [Roseovarius salis]|uniref:hypothetical protein n=1 Tax=Roseovarius salis TaxID=3376063 RepID=UPI0037CC8144